MSITRKTLAAAAALAIMAGAAQAEEIALQLAWLPNAASAGEIVALKKGFFSEAGLEVTLLPGGPGSNPVQEVLSGTADVAIAYAPQIMYAAARGLPIKSFAASFQKAPLSFYSLGDSNITSVADWKGKRVGASQSAAPQIAVLLDDAGLTMDDITFVQAQVPGLLQDQVDIIAAWPTNVAQIAPITTHASGYNEQSIWDNGLQFQSNYYIATEATLDGDADMLKAFLAAVDKGWSYAADNPEEAVALMKEVAPALEADKEALALDVIVSDFVFTEETVTHGFGNIDPDRWQRTLDRYRKLGELDTALNSADVFDASILDGVERSKR